jgi:hypothetical protein
MEGSARGGCTEARFLMMFAAIGLAVVAATRDAAAASETAWPSVPGAVFALRTTDIAVPVIAFDAKGRDLMAFSCATRGRALFGRFYELVCDGGSFYARDAGTWIGQQVATSGAFTLEATITPAEAAGKVPGVVLAYGNDQGEDVALLQDQTGLRLRLQGAQPMAVFPVEAGASVHVLVAVGGGKWAAYRDGQPVRSGSLAGAIPAWRTRELVVGSGWSGAETWRGRIEGVAVFSRALTAPEAAKEAAAIKTLQAGRKPAASVKFRGTLVRQAKTSALEQIRPYTRSLTAAEYKVEQVLAGEWKDPTITVLHWMIMDGKRLPIADRQPGAAVVLKVDRLEDHPQLESCRRDEMEGDLALDLFYCESEEQP